MNKKNVLLITGILAVLFSLLFIVIHPATNVFIISYVFAIVGLAGLCWSVWYVLDNKKSYPWIASLPLTITTYLIIQLVISTIFVLIEQLAKWSASAAGFIDSIRQLQFAPGWYLLIHCALLLIFVIRIIMLKTGATYIETRGEQTKSKVTFLKSMQIDIDLLTSQSTDVQIKTKLSSLADKVRFSDPMSTESLQPLEQRLVSKVTELKDVVKDQQKTIALINEVELMLDERNKKCRLMK